MRLLSNASIREINLDPQRFSVRRSFWTIIALSLLLWAAIGATLWVSS
jgi:hypothetical protein